MKTFIINLDHDHERLKRTYECLAQVNITTDIERIPAVLGRALTRDQLEEECVWLARYFLPKAAIGCALSHIKCWKKLVADADASQCLIVEDDIYCDASFDINPLLSDLPAPEAAGILYLGYIRSTIDMFGLKDWYDANWARFQYPFATCAYIITKEAARSMLDYISSKGGIDQAIDGILVQAMKDDIVTSLIHRPPLFKQSSNDGHCNNTASLINDHSYPTFTKKLCEMNRHKSSASRCPTFDISPQAYLGVKMFQLNDSLQVRTFDVGMFYLGIASALISPWLILWLGCILCILLSVDILCNAMSVLQSVTAFFAGALTAVMLRKALRRSAIK